LLLLVVAVLIAVPLFAIAGRVRRQQQKEADNADAAVLREASTGHPAAHGNRVGDPD
jgi:hypothetical protein